MSELNFALEPAWPGSIPHVGLPALLGAALLLTAMTIWTYAGVRKATWRRIGIVLFLRLAALLLTFLAILRPSFGVTHLEGVEPSKLLIVFDQSESMKIEDGPDSAKRWQQVMGLWESRAVKSRLGQLAAEQKIEVVPYLGAEELREYKPSADADGKRTDIGAWLKALWVRYGHEKHLRGIVLFSDGADNGTRFSVQQEAGRWRGICPIAAFGAGNPNDPKFRKDIALTGIEVEPNPVAIKSKMRIVAKVQAPGFEKTQVEVIVSITDADKNRVGADNVSKIDLGKEIIVNMPAPDTAGEYKITVKVTPHPDEANPNNNEISTYVQVIKEKIKILWVDRPRVYEPVAAIRTIKTDPRFEVYYVERPIQPKDLDEGQYDVLVIGDIAAKRFAADNNAVFAKIAERVRNKMGLLMLGGEETFGAGGWTQHPELMALLPVDFAKAGFLPGEVRPRPAKGAESWPFLQLGPDPKTNDALWKKLEPLDGVALIGNVNAGGAALLESDKGVAVMAATAMGGRIVVFAGDSTWKTWLAPDTIGAYEIFWKRLALWMSGQQDDGNQLWITLDKRRVNAGINEPLGFKFGVKDKKGRDLPDAAFPVLKVIGPKQQEFAVTPINDQSIPYRRGVFQGAKEPGEYKIVITATAKELDGTEKAEARFLVVRDDIEMLQPIAEHEMLRKIALASGGRFFTATEADFLAYLDGLKNQVNSESRHKTTQWPDWNRMPASDHTRDQLAALWSSFALAGFLLFTALLGGEWLLRRMWGLV